MADLLDPSALLHVLQQLLPPAAGSEPQLRSPSDALAAMVHTVMTRLDFRLTGLSEDDRIASASSFEGADASVAANKLPGEWNAKGPDHYCFRYKHHQSSLDYMVKLVKLGGRVVVHGIALQGSKTSTLEIVLADYFSASFFPYPPPQGDAEPLVNGFIGSARIKDLVIAYKTQVLQTLVPGLRKDGYTEETTDNNSSASTREGDSRGASSSQPQRPYPGSAPPPRAPFAGDEDDPSQPAGMFPGRNPMTIGDRDLDPLGGSPLRLPPRFGGGSAGGFAPPPLFPGGDSGGGMYVGPDHPMFRNRFPPPGAQGLPPGAVPPGARFDPIFPNEPDVGGARPQHPPRHGDPDWDDLAPPRPENPFPNRPRQGGGPGPDTRGWYA
ncbi:uncharacterized protein PAN0_006c2840 [Moesziomyces antarcticus]|uniref:Uncharacterized protein n=2 Tax=Pseudozyma antarctica TaxID=84753 RepID=A0A5C3FMJ0_PSEA2|nr:uncharacterized protein PAN0_006c2840 [Moesziomyces antarcticus]GAK64626.1 conserved hypothetical protein [Moesziomyces antarcticus]SPO45604.1 uncharacterized protein PSANT_03290 [Moesziomyces antarcticus]